MSSKRTCITAVRIHFKAQSKDCQTSIRCHHNTIHRPKILRLTTNPFEIITMPKYNFSTMNYPMAPPSFMCSNPMDFRCPTPSLPPQWCVRQSDTFIARGTLVICTSFLATRSCNHKALVCKCFILPIPLRCNMALVAEASMRFSTPNSFPSSLPRLWMPRHSDTHLFAEYSFASAELSAMIP